MGNDRSTSGVTRADVLSCLAEHGLPTTYEGAIARLVALKRGADRQTCERECRRAYPTLGFALDALTAFFANKNVSGPLARALISRADHETRERRASRPIADALVDLRGPSDPVFYVVRAAVAPGQAVALEFDLDGGTPAAGDVYAVRLELDDARALIAALEDAIAEVGR